MLTYVAAALAGCGGGSPTAANAAETHLVALANAICRESNDSRVTGATVLAKRDSELAMLRSLARADRRLPRVETYISDLAARSRLRAVMLHEASARKNGSATDAFSLLKESYRLDAKVDVDENALRLTACIGPRPRPPIEG